MSLLGWTDKLQRISGGKGCVSIPSWWTGSNVREAKGKIYPSVVMSLAIG